MSIGLLNLDLVTMYRNEFKFKIDEALATTFSLPEIVADANEELQDVFKPYTYVPRHPVGQLQNKRFVDSIQDALDQAMLTHKDLILMGQDIAEYGGVFKVTQGLLEKYGKNRVRNTPLCESAIIAAGLGLSLCGYRSVIEMQFADFVTCGFNQITNNLAKTHYRWQHSPSVVIRMPTGAGVAAGPFHSQSNESWFFHIPGLKVVYPSNPQDAKGLLLAAIEDPAPVIYFEHKVMYRSLHGDVPEGYYTTEIGKAAITQAGNDISIITYGMGVHWALDAAKEFPDASIEIIDLRTLIPWDTETVSNSISKTGKCIILHEDTLTGGVGAEIAAYISEHLFQKLDAPVVRIAGMDTPVPFAKPLEDNFLPVQRFKAALQRMIDY